MPFAVGKHDGVLTLTLDTPGSPINIFNHATAHQLIEVLSTVTPATTRAIVFETAKPHSFINGVGLLLAHASQGYDDIVRASTPPWTAYRAVRDAPVPTIAVVQGNCFGCGVEFALNCDYRVAADRCETQFYMTELNDYLFIPLFGSTWNLPAAVGLADAIDLLLWGARWDAATAGARGLVDEVIHHENLADGTRSFVQRVLAGTQPSRRRGRISWSAGEEGVSERARRRIESLPPVYHQVYMDALDLLVAGARQEHTYLEHQTEELRCSAASALSPLGKAAYAFFYLRQMASERAGGRARGDERPVRLAVAAGAGADVHAWVADLRSRRLPGVFTTDGDRDFRLGSPPAEARSHRSGDAAAGPGTAAGDVAVRTSLAEGPEADAEIYAPTHRSGGRLIELAVGASGLGPDDVARLTRTLQRLGFEVARTAPVRRFVSTGLLLAFFSPLVEYVTRGGDVVAINAALRHIGFVRRPHDLLASIDRGQLARLLATAMDRLPSVVEAALMSLDNPRYGEDHGDDVVVDALCLSLLDAVLSARAHGEVRDTSVLDLIARELLDFPRHLCSLCTWLKRARVAEAVARDSRVGSLVTDGARDAARAFAVEGREFYRGAP